MRFPILLAVLTACASDPDPDPDPDPNVPDTEITDGPSGMLRGQDVAFEFRASIASTFRCRLDDDAFESCTSPAAYTGLGDGAHTFEVVAATATGVDPSPASRLFTLDNLAPETTITSGPGLDSEPTFEFVAGDADATVECRFDGAAFAACTSPRQLGRVGFGAHVFEVRARDGAGNSDATPDTASWTFDNPQDITFTVMAANTTSGSGQTYEETDGPFEGPGLRIFRALKPDIVAVQEMNFRSNTASDFDALMSMFGPTYVYFRGTGRIANGVISRYPFCAGSPPGEWDIFDLSDREFTYACIDIPGPINLWVVSIHLKASSGEADRRLAEADQLVGYIEATIPAGDYLVIGGDLNTYRRDEPALVGGGGQRGLGSVAVVGGPYPADMAGTSETNAGRNNPYDWVMNDADLEAKRVPVVIGARSFPAGVVCETRVYSPLSDVAPARQSDSGASAMQHMAVIKAFTVTE
ncbi:MAG: endonuclease/exonuclease/phosphatase family protein [Kofleriaceae bacterium]